MIRTNKIILAIFILSMIALIFTGCGGIPVTPENEDIDQEYIVEEKYFNVDASQGGTYSLNDGTEVKIDPGDLSDDAYLVLKKVNYDLELSKIWDLPKYIYIIDILDCKDLYNPIDLYMVSSQVEYLEGGIIRVKDDTFELVKEFTNAEGEKVQVAIEEIGKAAYMFVTNPINNLVILNDLVSDIHSAVQYYYDGNCTSLFGLYQQVQQEEEIAGDDLENYPGVTREDAEEIFAEINSWETIIDLGAELITELAPNPVTAAYSIYSAFIKIGEICQYFNVYMIAENKADIYSSKIFKRRVIKYLYGQGCIGNEGGEDYFLGYWVNEDTNTPSITKIDIQKNNNLLEIYMWGKCHPTDCDWAAMNNPGGPATTTVDDADDGVLNIVWYPDFAIKTQEITYLGGDRLEVYTFTDFYPDDIYGREDYERYDYFIKSN